MGLPNGTILPPGIYVDINSAAMNRRVEIFGVRPDVFEPLRLRQDGETEKE